MTSRRRITVLVLCVAASTASVQAQSFTARIVDDQTGEPVAGSVIVTDGEGNVVEIDGPHEHVMYLQRRWCYVDGGFGAPIVGEGNTVEVRRGLETLPLRGRVRPDASPQEFRLRRWIDMAAQGYMSGDTHVHFLDEATSHVQMRAEDLEVLNLLTSDFTNDRGKFTGELSAVSTPGHWVYVGQEFRDWQQGHINLLRLRQIIEPFEPFGGIFRENAYRHLLVAPAARAAREQGAAVTWAHFGDIPGAESPVDISMGLIDAVDLITQSDPTGIPLHWPPWRMDRPAHLDELAALTGIELYYQYLNSGFRLPLAAGTDKMGDDIPVGSSRLYVRVSEPRDFDAWIDGLQAGNGFITNGPMLTFDVDGHSAGEVIETDGPRRVTARATARSIHPFERLEVMVNGVAAALSDDVSRDASGIYSASIEAPIDLDASAWVAARVAQPRGVEPRVLVPRRMTVFAHTNPIYFLAGGGRVRVQESIDYLTLYLRYTEQWFRTGARFNTPQERAEGLESVREALGLFDRL